MIRDPERSAARRCEKDVARARRALEAATTEWQAAVEVKREMLEMALDPRGRHVSHYAGVRIWERWIETPSGACNLAAVTTTIDSQPNAGHSVGGVLLLGAAGLLVRKQGTIYLNITSEHLFHYIAFPDSQSDYARKLASIIENCARAARHFEANREGIIQTCRDQYDETCNSAPEVWAAQAELERAQAALSAAPNPIV